MNLYSFIENLKNVSLAHYDVNEFNCGDVYGIMNKKYHKYPCVVLTVDNIQKGQNDTNMVNGNLFYIDRQLADESNKLYIQSQGVSVLNNIFNKSYNNGGYPFDTQQFTPFSEKFADLCAGVYCTFSAIVESEDICDNGAYEPKTITITKNGIYDVVGYDEANVDVDAADSIDYYWIMPHNYGVPQINYSDNTTTLEIKFRLKNTSNQSIYDDGYTSLIYEDNQYKARLNGGEWTETLIRETDAPETRVVKLTGTKLQIGYYLFDLQDGGHKWSYGQQMYIGNGDNVGDIDIYYCKLYWDKGDFVDYEPSIDNGATVLKDAVSGNILSIDEEVKTEEKTLDITKNGAYEVFPSDNHYLSKVNVNVNIPSELTKLPSGVRFENSRWTECPSFDYVNLTTAYHLFYNNSNLVKIGEMLNTGNITNMTGMFDGCSSITTTPSMDTSNVTSMSSMFNYCRQLTSVPSMDTSNVTTMANMFVYCSSLTTIPLFDTSKVTSIDYMFDRCGSLTSIPALNTSNVTTAYQTFRSCSKLITIPLLDMSSVNYITNMFFWCDKLTDLGGFTDMGKSFTSSYTLSITSSYLTNQSVQNMIDTVFDMNQNTQGGSATLKLAQSVIDAMTDEQKSQLTSKGWTLTA